MTVQNYEINHRIPNENPYLCKSASSRGQRFYSHFMDHYIVSARKYRPSIFASVVGQAALTATLKNAIATNRLAHSYLFCGSRGVGKTSCARIFAKTINCEHPTPDGEACNECPSCLEFNRGNSMNIIELDAASNNGVDAIRQLVEQVQNPPSRGNYRVFIVDEVHMLSSGAFNAFLKTLEEPPSYVIFILATTEKHKIIPTILSRCQIFDFNRITVRDMVDHLKSIAANEGITVEDPALTLIARKADGAMRDALSIFDQVAASTRNNITYEATLDNLNILDYTYYNRLIEAFLSSRTLESWLIYKEIRDKGFDSHFMLTGLADYLRDLMVAMSPQTIQLLEADDEVRARMAETARKCSPQFIYQAMNLCNEADLNWRTVTNKQFLVELTLAKICQLQSPAARQAADGASAGQQLQPIAGGGTTATPQANAPQAVPPVQHQQAPSSTPAPRPVAPQAAQTTHKPYSPPAPAVTQARQPSAPAYGRPRTVKTVGQHSGFSLKGSAQSQGAAAAAATASAEHRANPYTSEQLAAAWRQFMDANPTRHILTNTMRASAPVRVEGDSYVMTVENDKQREEVCAAMPEILAHVRAAIANDNFSLAVEINTGAPSPMTWSDRDVLENMKQTPAVAGFISSLSLTLS